MANADLKQLAKDGGVYLWQVGVEMGLNDGNFSRMLRRELPEEEKIKIRAIIAELSQKAVI